MNAVYKYPSFSKLILSCVNFINDSKNVRGHQVYVGYESIEQHIIDNWAPIDLKNVSFLHGADTLLVHEVAADIIMDWLVGLHIGDKSSTGNKLKNNEISAQLETQSTVEYLDLMNLTYFSDFVINRLGEFIINSYDHKKRLLSSGLPLIEDSFNNAVYGEEGDTLLNAFIYNIEEQLQITYQNCRKNILLPVNELKPSLSILDELGKGFELNRQNAPYSLSAVSMKEDLFQENDTGLELEIICVPDVDKLENRVLARIKSLSPSQFEKFSLRIMAELANSDETDDIADLIEHHGTTGDGGIDGIVKSKNKFQDYELHYVQCKRYTDKTVGRPQVQEFVGAMDSYLPKSGIFITTSTFSKQAWQYKDTVRTKNVRLIDGKNLVNFMIGNKIGIKEIYCEPVLEIDEEFFSQFAG